MSSASSASALPPPPSAAAAGGSSNHATLPSASSLSSSLSSELSLPPSVTGPLYGILSLDLCEVIQDNDDQVTPQQQEQQQQPTAMDNTEGCCSSPTKFRVVWWGDTTTIKDANSTTQQQQQLLTPGNIATPFDKCKISYNIRCTPPKFLKYLNDARSVSLRGVGSPELALQVCKLPLQPAVAEARSGGTMTIRIDGCFPIVNTHRESKRMGQKLRLKLSVDWKTNAPNQFTTTTAKAGVSYSHYNPTKSPPPPAGGMGTCAGDRPPPPPPPMVIPPHSGIPISPSHHTSAIASSSATPSYGNFIDNNYSDNTSHQHLHPPPPPVAAGGIAYNRPSPSQPTVSGCRVYPPPPPVMELPAATPSPTYYIGPPPPHYNQQQPSPYSRYIASTPVEAAAAGAAAALQQQQQRPTPSINTSRWQQQNQQLYDGVAGGSILFRQNSGASLVPADPSTHIDPSPPLPPLPQSKVILTQPASKATNAVEKYNEEEKMNEGRGGRGDGGGGGGLSTALQLAAVYSEPFGFLPSSTKPSDRQWAELLAADPMFESPHHGEGNRDSEKMRSTTPIRMDKGGGKRKERIHTPPPNQQQHNPPSKRVWKSQGTPTSGGEGHKKRTARTRKRSVDKSTKKPSSTTATAAGAAAEAAIHPKSTAPRRRPVHHHHPVDATGRHRSNESSELWVFMAVQSLTPTDGGPPLPHDLIVRLRGPNTVTQELDKPPLDGYGYYGEEELRYLAMVNDALITQYDDDEEDEEDYGTNNRSPRVQAAIELWQGENQLYGVGRIALDLAPRDLSALSNRALVRMEALVDCVSGWSGAILATCQLLVDVSSDRVPLENALQMRFKHHIFNDNKEQRKKKLTNRSGHHLDNSSSKSYIENEIMDEKQAASPKKLNDTLAVLKMNLRKSNEALLEELSDGPSSPGINAAAVGEEEELTSPQVLQRAVPIAAVIDGNSAAVDDVGDVGYDGKALLTSVGTSPIILPEEEEEKHPAASPTPPPTPSSNSTTRQDDSIISYRFIDDSMKGCTLNHHHHQLNHTSSSAVVALNDKESARLLPSRLDDNEQGGLSYYPRINNVGNGPGASSPVSHGHVGVSREEREQKEYVNMHLPYNIIPMSTTTTTRRRSISSTMMIDHGAAAVTNDDASDDNVPYADTETLLRALALMDEKVKYLTNRDTNVGVSSSSSPKVIAEITTVPRTAAITGSNTSSQHQAAAGGGDDASSDHCAVSDGIEVDGVEVMDIREEGDHDDVIARPEEQHIDESGGMSENPSNSGDESKVGMNDDIEKDDIGDDYGKEGVARIEVDDDENDGHTEKEEHSSTLRRIEELARRVVELETSTRSAAAATSTTTTAAAAAPVVASQGYAGVNVATFSDDDDDAEEKSQTARNEGIYGEELEDNVMGHMKETRKRRSHSPIDQRKEENVDLHTEKASQAAPAAAGPAALASPQVPLMVDESISNPDSSLQEHISQGVIAAPSVESSSCSWLEEGPKMSSIRDTSLSPEIILEPAVRSPREITETRKYKAFEEAPLETVGRADDIVAIRHPTPVVDIEAIRQISRLNDRIAHLEVTAEEVVAKYKQAEARLLQNHHHLHQVNASRHVGDSQTFKFLPSESWIPFSDPPQPGRMGPSNTWHNKYKEVNGANISQCVEDRHHNSYEDEDEAGCYGKRKPPTSREVLCISEREYRHPHKPPASVRLEMKRALVRDAKRVAAILRGRDRLSLIDDDDEDDSD